MIPMPINPHPQPWRPAKKKRAVGRVVYSNAGHVVVSLREVLSIWKLRVEYREEEFEFISTKDASTIAVYPRSHDYPTPWECLRAAGLLDRDRFEGKARAYLSKKAKPRPLP